MAPEGQILEEVVVEDAGPGGGVSRRRFLKGITAVGLAGVGVAILGKISTAKTFLGFRPAMAEANSYLVIEPALCTGCRTCMVACSTYNSEGRASMELARLFVPRHPFNSTWAPIGTPVNYEPRPCLQCADAPCLKICPVSAIQIDYKSGTNARVIDERACIGCRACIEECGRLYDGIPRIEFDEEKGKAIKCHQCGGNPQCVAWCPTHAISFVKATDFTPGTKRSEGQLINIEQDYRIQRNEDRIRELGYPQFSGERMEKMEKK